MQIACTHCGARYAFDAALIPAAGYDARCTSCQAVFFVAPSTEAEVEAEAEAQTRAAPAEDAGHQAAGLAQDRARLGADHPERAAGPDAGEPFVPKSLHRGTMSFAEEGELSLGGRPGGRRTTRSEPRGGGPHAPGEAAQDAPARRPGRRHPDLHADEAALLRRPRARLPLFLGVALVAVIGTGVVVGVVRSKSLHIEPQVQMPIHVVHAPDPIAHDAFERGLAALWQDTPSGYVAAAKAFDAAIARDPEFTDAWAGAALAALLQAHDAAAEAERAQAQARSQLGAALSEVAQLARGTALAAERDAEPTHDVRHMAEVLRAQQVQGRAVADAQAQAAQLAAEALRQQRHAASLLLRGQNLLAQTPLLSSVLAMWYAQDAHQHALAVPQLAAAEQLAGGTEADRAMQGPTLTDPAAALSASASATAALRPYTPLRLWVRARLDAQDAAASQTQVVAAYEAALRLQPELRRARLELALYELHHGHPDVARALLEDLAHGQPPHPEAQRRLQQMAASSAAAAAAASAAPSAGRGIAP